MNLATRNAGVNVGQNSVDDYSEYNNGILLY
jgi:hypothetical protein